MLEEQNINFREAKFKEDSVIAQHFYQMWGDLDVPSDFIRSDWLDITLKYRSC